MVAGWELSDHVQVPLFLGADPRFVLRPDVCARFHQGRTTRPLELHPAALLQPSL